MAILIKPGGTITGTFEWHKSVGTTGEDNGYNPTPYGAVFNKPATKFTKLGAKDLNDGTHAEYFQFTAPNGFKFSGRTCHCIDYKAVGDNYTGSTGYHLHAQYCVGHKSMEWIQENRNSSAFIPFAELEKEASAYGPAPTTPPPSSSTKTFKAVRENKSSDNGTFYFDEKYYNDLKDGKQANEAYDTKGGKWLKDTTWTKVYSPSGSTSNVKDMTNYYDDGWHKEPNSSYIPFKSNDPDLVVEKDTTRYGSGAYRLTKTKNNWKVDTRFK